MKYVGIIGAGTAGLHLGLYLLEHGVKVTIVTDHAPRDYASMRLANTVAHHAVTIRRERALEINHWSDESHGYFGDHYFIGTKPQPLRFFGELHAPSRAVDDRIYQPVLMEDFMKRGGKMEFRAIQSVEVPSLSARFELLVSCTGKGPFGQLFQHEPELSPISRPQRVLCAGIFKGITQRDRRAVTMHFAPGVGEIIETLTVTFNGMQTALVIENIVGGELEVLAKLKYSENRRGFLNLLLEKLRKYYPDCEERIDEREFDLANIPLDIIQGGVTPTVRKSFVRLASGKLAIALGEVHSVIDPLLGQGVNVASYAAWILGEESFAHNVYNERFVNHVGMRRRDRVLAATRWTNYMLKNLATIPVELRRFINALSQFPKLANEFTDNYNYPERQWGCFASVERMRYWCSSRIHSAIKPKNHAQEKLLEKAA